MTRFPDRMKVAAAALTLVALAACASTRTGPIGFLPASQPDAAGAGSWLAGRAGAPAKTLYVAAPGRIFIYSATANGLARPLATITGNKTGLNAPAYIAYDATKGYLWVSNCAVSTTAGQRILGFPATAKGNVAPSVTIGGSATGLSNCEQGIALDTKGNIYVTDLKKNQISEFAKGASGNVAPIRTITGLTLPAGVAVAKSGIIWVADSTAKVAGSPCTGDLREYAANAKGAAKPLKIIGGCATLMNAKKQDVPTGVALDSAGNAYVGAGGLGPAPSYVLVFAKLAKPGNFKPMRTITDSKGNNQFAQPSEVAVDAAGYTYVGNTFNFYAILPVVVFKPLANGKSAPRNAVTTSIYPQAYWPTGVAVH